MSQTKSPSNAGFGEGICKVPDLPVPNMMAGDSNRDLAADYQEALNSNNNLAMIYIRMAATFKTFANALEKELESFRTANKNKQGS